MIEEYRKIDGYENYEVSNLGNVRSLNYKCTGKPQILKQGIDKKGYLRVGLCKSGKKKLFKVHRLVASAFIENPQGLKEVNHINEIKTDNSVENLEWCDSKYNNNFGTRNQRISEVRRGKPHPHIGKPKSEETKRKIAEARKRYWQSKRNNI